MIQYMDIAGIRVGGVGASNRYVSEIDGLIGVPGVRGGEAWLMPTADGSVDVGRQFMTPRVVTVEGSVWSSSVASAMDSFGDMVAAWSAQEFLITWRVEGGVHDVQQMARLNGPVLHKLSSGRRGPFVEYQASFRLPDPRWYSTSVTTATDTSSPWTQTLTNAGDVYTYVNYTAYGPFNGFFPIGLDIIYTAPAGEPISINSHPFMRDYPSSLSLFGAGHRPARSIIIDGIDALDPNINGLGNVDWAASSGFPVLAPGSLVGHDPFTGGGTGVGTQWSYAFRSAWLVPT